MVPWLLPSGCTPNQSLATEKFLSLFSVCGLRKWWLVSSVLQRRPTQAIVPSRQSSQFLQSMYFTNANASVLAESNVAMRRTSSTPVTQFILHSCEIVNTRRKSLFNMFLTPIWQFQRYIRAAFGTDRFYEATSISVMVPELQSKTSKDVTGSSEPQMNIISALRTELSGYIF